LALFAVYIGFVATAPDDGPYWLKATIWTLRVTYLWIALLAILGWSRALLDRPFRWLRWANESVYPWYVLHQSLIVGLAFWLVPMKLGAVAEGALILAGTVAGCWAIGEAVKRLPWARPLFGLKRRPTPALDVSPAAPFLGDNRGTG
jgi:glucans biosynthesis protein C